MAIPQQTIDHILDRTDIVDTISKYVKLKKSGRTYSGCCPFHQEKSPSFHVYADKQYFHCFGCQANGNAIKFLMDIEHKNFLDVMRDLSNQTGIELPKYDNNLNAAYRRLTPNVHNDHTKSNDVAVPTGNLYELLELVAKFYEDQLPHSKTAVAYFSKRGLKQETISYWRLGYAPEDWQHLSKAFPADIEGLKILGLVRTSDNGRDFSLLRDRVIFPIRDHRGRVVGFGGRALNDDIKPKYINSPESEVFKKNQLLFGLYEGRQAKAEDWLMVEGFMDVISLHQFNVTGAVATLGTASNADHLNTLFKSSNQITIAFDGDLAGQKAARRTLEIALPLLTDGRELKFFILPNEHDPDSLIRKEGLETFDRLRMASPLLSEFIFGLLTRNIDLNSPEAKSKVMGELHSLRMMLPKNGTYKQSVWEFFKDKLGLVRKYQPRQGEIDKLHDATLSFKIKIRDEDYCIAILMYQPALYSYFVDLVDLIHDDSLLFKILNIFERIYNKIPEDLYLSQCYLRGACAMYSDQINEICDHININKMVLESEKPIDHMAEECSLSLQHKLLKHKLTKPGSLKQSLELKARYMEVGTKLKNLAIEKS